MIITGCDVGGQRSQGIKWSLPAEGKLQVHVLLDHVHRHVARPLDHHLHIVLPGDICKLPKSLQLTDLGLVVGIVDRPRTQSITEAEGYIIGLHDLADLLEVGVEKAFPVMGKTPLRHDRSPSRNDSGQASGSQWHIT